MLPDGRCVGPIRWDSSGGRTIRTPWLGLLPDRWPTAGPANDLRIGGNKRIRSQLRPIYLKARPSLSALFLGRQTQPRDLASIEAAARSMPHTPPHRHRRRGRTVREGAGGLTVGVTVNRRKLDHRCRGGWTARSIITRSPRSSLSWRPDGLAIGQPTVAALRGRPLDLLPNKNLRRDSVPVSELVHSSCPPRCVVLDRGQQPARSVCAE
jgi:hypothetical protein